MKGKTCAALLGGALILVLIMPLLAAEKTTSSDVSKEAKETWEAFKNYVADQKHAAVAHGRDLLKKADAEIDELENKASQASGDAKKEYAETIKNLKSLRAEAGKKLDDLEHASGSAWDSSKEGFVKAYKDLYAASRDAAAKFK